MSEREICQSCRFYLPREGSQFSSGVCRRNPPLVVIDEQTQAAVSVRPLVQPASWCGEWKPNDEQASK